MPLALTQEEIFELTRPLKQPAAQIKYLRSIGIRAERRPNGQVLVLREWLAPAAESGAESAEPQLVLN